MEEKEQKRKSRVNLFLKIYINIQTVGKAEYDIEILHSRAREYLASKKYFESPKAFDFYDFIEKLLEHFHGSNTGEKAIVFKDLQDVFRKLEDYGLRLLKRPWRREFYTIKLFTTYFIHDIESKLPNAVEILELYGYKDASQNTVKMTPESLNSDKISLVCFDLFLSRIELEVMYEICTKIEETTSDFTLIDVVKARRETKGDVNEAVENFRKEHPDILVKRKKIDVSESERQFREGFEKSYKRSSEDEDKGRTGFGDGRSTGQGRTTRDTKYPPTSTKYDFPSSSENPKYPRSTNSAKVRYISSSFPLDNVSDADLYGHGDDASSSQDEERNIPMDTQESQDWRGETYKPNDLYVNMSGADGNCHDMVYSPDNGLASCTSLPPPSTTYIHSTSSPGIPPPTYQQAVQIPGNDWVMVDDKVSDRLSNNISAMNIGENGYDSRTSSGVMGVRGGCNTPDTQRLKAASAGGMGMTAIGYANGVYYLTEPQGTSTKSRTVASSKVKGVEGVFPERSLLNGSDNDYKTPAKPHNDYQSPATSYNDYKTPATSYNDYKTPATSYDDYKTPATSFNEYKTPAAHSTKVFDGKQLEKTTSSPFERTGDSTQGKTDLQRRSTSNSYDILPIRTTEDHRKRLTKSEPGELIIPSTRMSDTARLYLTSSSPSSTNAASSSKPQSAMITRSQARATAGSRSDVTRDPLQGSSKTTQQMAERYNKENCSICTSKATHYCVLCKKRTCKSCTTVIPRLSCRSYKDHVLVELNPTTNNEKSGVDSKDVCSFCGYRAASHNCIYCNKKSCGSCHISYTKDPCVPSSKTHHFVDQQQQKSTYEKQETATQKQATLSSMEKEPNPVPNVSGENYCDFCALAANLICKTCLKTICDKCKYAYTQDLCPPTKKEHQFETIYEESTNTDEADWSCERCTFLNSSSNRICAVCATSRGVNKVELPQSGTRMCQKCTYANEQGATVCKACGCTFGLDNPESYI